MKRDALDEAAERQLRQSNLSLVEGQGTKVADKGSTPRTFSAREGEEADEEIRRAVVMASLFA